MFSEWKQILDWGGKLKKHSQLNELTHSPATHDIEKNEEKEGAVRSALWPAYPDGGYQK